MKRISIAIATMLCLCASLSWAGEPMQLARMSTAVVGAGSGAAAAGQWHYGSGSDNYATGQAISTGDTLGGPITLTSAGSITKIAVKVGATAPSFLKIGLYYNNAGTWTLHECVTITDPGTNAWAEATLISSYTNDPSEVVRVVAVGNTGWTGMYAAGSGGFYLSLGYESSCGATPTFGDDNQWSSAVFQ